MAYELQPGTLPHRVVNWLKLQPIGGEFSSTQIAEEIGASLEGFASTLQTAKSHGVLRMRKELRVCYWSLGDGTPEPLPFDLERDEPLHVAPVAPVLKGLPQPVFKLRKPKVEKVDPKLLPSGPLCAVVADPVVPDVLMSFTSQGFFTLSKGPISLILDPREAKTIADFVGRISCN